MALASGGCRCGARDADEGRRADGAPLRLVPLTQRFTREQPFAFVLPQLAPLDGVGGVRASDCQRCHTEIYAEWRESTHATALHDIQYQAEIFKPGAPRWLCLNCHIPVQNQRRFEIGALERGDVLRPVRKPNPGFDPAMQAEGVTCAACHVRRDAAGRSTVIGAIGSPFAPHPVRRDRAFLRRVCLRCHDPRGERITPRLVCWFHTRDEWASGPDAKSRDCVDCHMPTTRRRLVPHDARLPERDSHRHHWVGGGIPKWYRGYDRLLARGYRPAADVRLERWRLERDGRGVSFEVSLRNTRAGHWLPTGDPERFLLVVALLETSGGRRLARATWRIGQRWEWEPRARKIADNRLRPRERRLWKHVLRGARGTAGARLVISALHVRLSTRTARHMQRQHRQVRGTYLTDASGYVRDLGRHYPMAIFLHREEVDLLTGRRRSELPAELLDRSKRERLRPLSLRDY